MRPLSIPKILNIFYDALSLIEIEHWRVFADTARSIYVIATNIYTEYREYILGDTVNTWLCLISNIRFVKYTYYFHTHWYVESPLSYSFWLVDLGFKWSLIGCTRFVTWFINVRIYMILHKLSFPITIHWTSSTISIVRSFISVYCTSLIIICMKWQLIQDSIHHMIFNDRNSKPNI